METNKRQEFLKQFHAEIDQIYRQEFYKETATMQPSLGEIIDGYKTYISDLGESFLDIAEMYNRCLQIARTNEIIGDTKLKLRIKDFSSSHINSGKKMLDDVFGMEVVPATELEKEFLILFNHLAFKVNRDKKYNKKNGYKSYHCTADLSIRDGNLKQIIKEIIKNYRTNEYTEQNGPQKRVKVFPLLSRKIRDPKQLTEITRVLELMMNEIKKEESTNNPLIEFHFSTAQVVEEAIRGSASHNVYKATNPTLIEQYFRDGRLYRGINCPWKFTGEKDGIKLQDFYDTLLENWPFLKDIIVQRRIQGLEEIDKIRSEDFDKLFASQFVFLNRYLDFSENNQDKNVDISTIQQDKYTSEKWGMLKALMIANKIEMGKTKEGDIADEIGKMWPDTK